MGLNWKLWFLSIDIFLFYLYPALLGALSVKVQIRLQNRDSIDCTVRWPLAGAGWELCGHPWYFWLLSTISLWITAMHSTLGCLWKSIERFQLPQNAAAWVINLSDIWYMLQYCCMRYSGCHCASWCNLRCWLSHLNPSIAWDHSVLLLVSATDAQMVSWEITNFIFRQLSELYSKECQTKQRLACEACIQKGIWRRIIPNWSKFQKLVVSQFKV